jgi:hypothetical protein
MNEQTLRKMHVLGADNEEAVSQMIAAGIPLSAIPTWLGGECEGRPLLELTKEIITEAAVGGAGGM